MLPPTLLNTRQKLIFKVNLQTIHLPLNALGRYTMWLKVCEHMAIMPTPYVILLQTIAPKAFSSTLLKMLHAGFVSMTTIP